MASPTEFIAGKKIESFSKGVLQSLGIYRRGLVRIAEDGKSLINNLTGETYETLGKAITGTRKYGLAEANILTGIGGLFSEDNPEFAVLDRKSTRLNSSHVSESRMPSSA